MSGPFTVSIDACTTSFWAYWRLCDGLSPLVSVAIPLVIPGQAVAMLGSVTHLRHPKCDNLATYHRIWLVTTVLFYLAVSEKVEGSTDLVCTCLVVRVLISFHQCAWQMEQQLDLDLINVTLILSCGRTDACLDHNSPPQWRIQRGFATPCF